MNGRFRYTKSVKVVLGLVMIFALQSCTSSNAQSPQVKRISNEELQTLLAKSNIQLVDVRTPQEYAQGHLANSQLIDFTRPDFKEKISQLDKDQPIVVYCAVGGRSASATNVLKSAGFKEIYDLQRGIRGWLAAGLPVE